MLSNRARKIQADRTWKTQASQNNSRVRVAGGGGCSSHATATFVAVASGFINSRPSSWPRPWRRRRRGPARKREDLLNIAGKGCIGFAAVLAWQKLGAENVKLNWCVKVLREMLETRRPWADLAPEVWAMQAGTTHGRGTTPITQDYRKKRR